MSSRLQKKRRFALALVIASIILLIIIFILIHRSDKLLKVDTGSNLLNMQRPDWHGYIKLDNAINELKHHWSVSGFSKQADRGFESNEDIQAEFDRQISEIKLIFNSY